MPKFDLNPPPPLRRSPRNGPDDAHRYLIWWCRVLAVIASPACHDINWLVMFRPSINHVRSKRFSLLFVFHLVIHCHWGFQVLQSTEDINIISWQSIEGKSQEDDNNQYTTGNVFTMHGFTIKVFVIVAISTQIGTLKFVINSMFTMPKSYYPKSSNFDYFILTVDQYL